MMKLYPIAGAAVVLLCLSACEKPAGPTGAAATAASAPAQAPDSSGSVLPALPMIPNPVFGPDFVDTAGFGDLFEIAESRLALSRSTNAQIRDFATAMIAAHTRSTAALQAAVDASGETTELPTSLPDELQTKLAALTRASGGAFDKAYVADQIAAHTAALSAMRTYARRGDTPALKKFADGTAPVVADHLDRAKALQGSLR
jgi:putative membrane protein